MKSQLACYVVTLAFLVAGIERNQAQELGKFKDNDEWVQFVHHLMNKYYPDVPHELNLPEGYTLAFVLKDRDTALEHKALALHEPEGTPLTETMARIFPGAGIDPKGQMEQGSLCVNEEPGSTAGTACNLAVSAATGEVQGVFDYGDAVFGDRHQDFKYMQFHRAEEQVMLEAAIKSYEGATRIILDRGRIRFFNAIGAIGFLGFRFGHAPGERWCGRTLEEDVEWTTTALEAAGF